MRQAGEMGLGEVGEGEKVGEETCCEDEQEEATRSPLWKHSCLLGVESQVYVVWGYLQPRSLA
jgi:hypothetical protein